MVVVDADHPDIETYIDWKVKEEQKVAALVTGSRLNQKHLKAVLKACVNCEGSGDDCFDPEKNPALRREIKLARRAMVTDAMIKRVIQFARQGYKEIDFPIYDTDWDSEAYLTVSGQNSNNSVSLKDDFLRSVETDGDWNLVGRTTKKITKTLKARDLWEKIGYAAWASADPGLHFNTTMNDWHTCKASGDIRGNGFRARHFPRLQEERRAHAARDPQPPPRRPWPVQRLRGARRQPGADGPGLLPAGRSGVACASRLGCGARARREARLSQRPDHGDRADRHDRPRDGLRHYRHRARLRPGEIQEARRRRLLQ